MEHNKDAPEAFAEWLRARLDERGYDLRPRGGGQSRFATDAGIGHGTVSRLLRGQAAPETRVLQLIADALRVPLAEVLVAAGVITHEQLAAVQTRPPRPAPLTPEGAADELGIHDPQSRALFVSMTQTLRTVRTKRDGNDAAEN
ncbi:helix-turn-helix transcriptional regulator [Streptomyces sp. NPDC047046]|uniref:helix-turn-helix domain-containing protein n=1 Tax=Streptomyces sp. NPDC047046 TaxID=3155378 RepID=UPI0033DB0E58